MAATPSNARLAKYVAMLWLFLSLLASACVVNPVPTPGSAGNGTTANEFNDAAKEDVYSPPKTSDAAVASADTGEPYGGSADAMAADMSPGADVGNIEDSGQVADLSVAPTGDSADTADLPPDATVQAD